MYEDKKKYGKIKKGDGFITEIKKSLVGWTITGVGKTETYSTQDWDGLVEGGLTLLLKKGNKNRKVILGYTELGEWLEHIEELKETK